MFKYRKSSKPFSVFPRDMFRVSHDTQNELNYLLVDECFPMDERTQRQLSTCLETTFNVMVKWERAEVTPSTLTVEEGWECVEATDKFLHPSFKCSTFKATSRHGNFTVCLDERALG